MDFYVDLAVAVLLRLIKDRRSVARYYPALAKVVVTLEALLRDDPAFARIVKSKREE
jgi:hypothetical protein